MALNKAYIKKGLVTTRKGDSGAALDGGFDLMRWLKKTMDYLGIEYYDACCDAATIQRPLRYNNTTGAIEKFAGTWTSVTGETILRASAALDFPSILNGASSALTIALVGAVAGDTILVGVPVTTPATTGFTFTGKVLVSDVVTVTAFNGSGGTVDLGSGTFTVTVIR